MESNKQYILDSLRKQSDIVTGFIVLQSLALSYQFGNPNFAGTAKDNCIMLFFIIGIHTFIVISALIIVFRLGKKIKSFMEPEIEKALRPTTETFIKSFLIIAFGFIPVAIGFIILHHMGLI